MEEKIFKLEIGPKILEVNTRPLAKNANGSVLVKYGDTTVLATCVMSKKPLEGIDFFPLTVEYSERYYAAGKILGSRFIRREGRPTDEAVLISRIIDRALRPLFPKDLNYEVQIIITCLSWDGENDPATLGLFAASLGLLISDIPWNGPTAAVRVSKNDQMKLFPNYQEREESVYDLIAAGVDSDKGVLINMIDGQAKEASEQSIFEAFDFAKPEIKKLLDLQKEICEKIGKEKIKIEEKPSDKDLEESVKKFLAGKIEQVLTTSTVKDNLSTYQDSPVRGGACNGFSLSDLKNELKDFLKDQDQEKLNYGVSLFEKEIEKTFEENILNNEKRPDGRKLDQVRDLSCEVGLLPRTHGCGMFSRGETSALSILTLGSPSDHKLMEGMEVRGKKRFMHHYNFPPYCTGEVKPIRGTGRREIGHGMLGEKAILPMIPDIEDFPYTIRIVSEVLSSNGSSSMASTCAASLALMDAGVPIKNPVAGIAMGLVTDGEKYKILTDIQGPEDHHGHMDFKVAGTKNGVNAIQLDVKTLGLTKEILEETMIKAKKAREEILAKMQSVIAEPRKELSQYAPRIFVFSIKPEKIREVIGSGGKVINEIIDTCGVTIDIEDSGKVFITGEKEEAAKKAMDWIKNIVREVKAGEFFPQGKVKRILDFGAFVEILPGQEGMVHISQLADRRVEKVTDVVSVGDIIPVKVISIDQQGRINLSLKEAKNKN
ncbi:MAG: polyribonucleotide nucleotidyltransferase [Candidatus Paceibacterota bacterium]|jgi:polyribonucleotide nucleotidyltransferase|nr:polyribonucleotide nucleotidyltransferase [Candidatus Paceibacterota bacterium]MDD4830951.1 polyribonucleotide nucleotidyltransferase [Candidatus Paceibacterota bacterium]MDD4874891.1 polyribonucleotide nucleotidyltransferase [Candidatus Paceibacterota bacterium]